MENKIVLLPMKLPGMRGRQKFSPQLVVSPWYFCGRYMGGQTHTAFINLYVFDRGDHWLIADQDLRLYSDGSIESASSMKPVKVDKKDSALMVFFQNYLKAQSFHGENLNRSELKLEWSEKTFWEM